MDKFFETSSVYYAAHLISRYEDLLFIRRDGGKITYAFQNNDYVRRQIRLYNKSLKLIQPHHMIDSYILLKKKVDDFEASKSSVQYFEDMSKYY